MRNEKEILKELCRHRIVKRPMEINGVKEIIKERLQTNKRALEKELDG